ncbi:HET-domain-containing protein [Nemania serpens]|nr:HET-domain-containing protein [Nemania serpens]
MRLLRLQADGTVSLVQFAGEKIPRYAILSHTWRADEQEVTFQDILNGEGKQKIGYRKIMNCALQARKDKFQFLWVDSCCIDKSSSQELSEAINSMFLWYRGAAKCYAYLSDVTINKNARKNPPFQRVRKRGIKMSIQDSRWFTRSWTLQELLAPPAVEFFSRDWKPLGNRITRIREIHTITGIPEEALHGGPLSQFSVNERLSWAKDRRAKREEDKAYSLLGIFSVHMPLIYGEGEKNAFARLRKEIDQSTRYVLLTHTPKREKRKPVACFKL